MAMLYLRPPVAAGRYYELDPVNLRKQIDAAFAKFGKSRKKVDKVRAAIVPHAGYDYSGWVAASVYSILDRKEKINFVIFGTNHYMIGSKYATMKSGLWKTPLGGVSVDEKMTDSIIERSKIIEIDVLPHQNEHSIEIQLPMLQYVFGNDFKFVPITVSTDIMDNSAVDDIRIIGKAVADAVKSSKEKWVVLASSDFSHYVPQKLAEDTDKYLISPILKLNESSFLERVVEKNASACGIGAVAAAIVAAKALGSKKGRLMKYATSADLSGDKSSVVGYAGIIM